MTPARAVRAGGMALAVLLLAPSPPVSGQETREEGPAVAASESCDLCHGELEFLRQHTGTLRRARELVVPSSVLRLSAHDTLSCASCHTGFERHPHPLSDGETGAPGRVSTSTCVSCHEDAESLWRGSVHEREDEGADCSACHGVHDVLPVTELSEGPGMLRMNATCVDCHDTSVLPAMDPHADSVGCAACHGAHDTEAVRTAGSRVAPAAQYTTCGSCHEAAADSARLDTHGRAVLAGDLSSLALLDHEGGDAPPTCTSCHGSHGMLAPSHARFDQDMVEQCAVCHQDYADTYFGTYHGKATAVGSEIVATCDHCHGAHGIFPADVPASTVSDARVEETCGTCHEHVRPAFVQYDSHPNPLDRSRNAPLFYSFVFMNAILAGTLVVFGLHTLLWWVRLTIDRRKIEARGGTSHE